MKIKYLDNIMEEERLDKTSNRKRLNKDRIEYLIKKLLIEIGEDPEREGLKNTPKRVAKSFEFLYKGYNEDIEELLNNAFFANTSESMVIVKDVEFYSVCEHHILPFYGKCHIGYIPKDKIIGVSKLARIVDFYARRLQIQENLTEQIGNFVINRLDAYGVGVIIESKHLCMVMRGVEKKFATMKTSIMLGNFKNSSAIQNEFFNLIA